MPVLQLCQCCSRALTYRAHTLRIHADNRSRFARVLCVDCQERALAAAIKAAEKALVPLAEAV